MAASSLASVAFAITAVPSTPAVEHPASTPAPARPTPPMPGARRNGLRSPTLSALRLMASRTNALLKPSNTVAHFFGGHMVEVPGRVNRGSRSSRTSSSYGLLLSGRMVDLVRVTGARSQVAAVRSPGDRSARAGTNSTEDPNRWREHDTGGAGIGPRGLRSVARRCTTVTAMVARGRAVHLVSP